MHTMSGSSFAVPLAREADLVAVLCSGGFEVSRDDGLVASLSRVPYAPMTDGPDPTARPWPLKPDLGQLVHT